MANKKNWFKKGDAGQKASEKVDAESKARRDARGPLRFWLDYDSSAKVTFLDSPQFFLWEHNLKLNGKYNNFFTCLKDFDTCPICEDGENSSYILVGTIISHKKYKDREGNTKQNQKMLFVAKARSRQRLIKQIERRDGDLKFCAYEMSRGSTNTEASTGEDFEFLKRLTKAQLQKLAPEGKEGKDWLEPFDYEKIFAPKEVKELCKIIGAVPPVGSEEDDDAGIDDDDDMFAGDDDTAAGTSEAASDDDDDMFADDPEDDGEEFDEEALQEELLKLNTKAKIGAYVKDNEIPTTIFKKSMTMPVMREAILEFAKSGGAEEEEEVVEKKADKKKTSTKKKADPEEETEAQSIDDLL